MVNPETPGQPAMELGLRERFPDSFWSRLIDLPFVFKGGPTWTRVSDSANTV